MSDTSSTGTGLEAELGSLERFRDWLASLVAAQQPLEEWSLSLEALRQRWAPETTTEHATVDREAAPSGRLFF